MDRAHSFGALCKAVNLLVIHASTVFFNWVGDQLASIGFPVITALIGITTFLASYSWELLGYKKLTPQTDPLQTKIERLSGSLKDSSQIINEIESEIEKRQLALTQLQRDAETANLTAS